MEDAAVATAGAAPDPGKVDGDGTPRLAPPSPFGRRAAGANNHSSLRRSRTIMAIQSRLSTFFSPVTKAWRKLNANDLSWFIFQPEHPIRQFAKQVTEHWSFGIVVMTIIFANCLVMAMEPPICDEHCKRGTYYMTLAALDLTFTICFTVEILLQSLALCFAFGPEAYLHSGWSWIDLLATATGYLLFIPGADGGGLNGLRALRALRPLRALNAIPGLKILVECLLVSMPLLVDVLFLLAWVFFSFGIIALNVFLGKLRSRCMYQVTAPAGNVTSAAAPAPATFWLLIPDLEQQPCSQNHASSSFLCPAEYEGYAVACMSGHPNPNWGYSGFDNFGQASLNIFAVLTLDNWSEVQLYLMWDAMGAPVPLIFFIVLVFFGAFFAMQLLVAIMSSKFAQLAAAANAQPRHRRHNLELNTSDESDEEELYEGGDADGLPGPMPRRPRRRPLTQRLRRFWRQALLRLRLRYYHPLQREDLPRWRAVVWDVVHSLWFNHLSTLAVVLNTIVLAMYHYDMDPMWFNVCEIFNKVLTYVFIAEMVVKHVGLGVVRYWANPWNVLDGIVVIISVAELVLLATGGARSGMQAVRTFRLLRVLRSLKLLARVKGLRRLMKMVLRGFAALKDFMLLLALFIFIFSILGMQQFAGLDSFQEPPDDPEWPGMARANFDNLWMSAYTTFQILTCDNWLPVAWMGMHGAGDAAVLYFVTWVTIGNFVLLSLFLAILISSFQSDDDEEDEDPYADDVSRSTGLGSSAATQEGAPRPSNALQHRVAEHVAERLDPVKVKIMKRWLVMVGVTHGIAPDEMSAITRELDARYAHDPDSVGRDSSFTAPQLAANRRLTKRGTSRRRTAPNDHGILAGVLGHTPGNNAALQGDSQVSMPGGDEEPHPDQQRAAGAAAGSSGAGLLAQCGSTPRSALAPRGSGVGGVSFRISGTGAVQGSATAGSGNAPAGPAGAATGLLDRLGRAVRWGRTESIARGEEQGGEGTPEGRRHALLGMQLPWRLTLAHLQQAHGEAQGAPQHAAGVRAEAHHQQFNPHGASGRSFARTSAPPVAVFMPHRQHAAGVHGGPLAAGAGAGTSAAPGPPSGEPPDHEEWARKRLQAWIADSWLAQQQAAMSGGSVAQFAAGVSAQSSLNRSAAAAAAAAASAGAEALGGGAGLAEEVTAVAGPGSGVSGSTGWIHSLAPSLHHHHNPQGVSMPHSMIPPSLQPDVLLSAGTRQRRLFLRAVHRAQAEATGEDARDASGAHSPGSDGLVARSASMPGWDPATMDNLQAMLQATQLRACLRRSMSGRRQASMPAVQDILLTRGPSGRRQGHQQAAEGAAEAEGKDKDESSAVREEQGEPGSPEERGQVLQRAPLRVAVAPRGRRALSPLGEVSGPQLGVSHALGTFSTASSGLLELPPPPPSVPSMQGSPDALAAALHQQQQQQQREASPRRFSRAEGSGLSSSEPPGPPPGHVWQPPGGAAAPAPSTCTVWDSDKGSPPGPGPVMESAERRQSWGHPREQQPEPGSRQCMQQEEHGQALQRLSARALALQPHAISALQAQRAGSAPPFWPAGGGPAAAGDHDNGEGWWEACHDAWQAEERQAAWPHAHYKGMKHHEQARASDAPPVSIAAMLLRMLVGAAERARPNPPVSEAGLDESDFSSPQHSLPHAGTGPGSGQNHIGSSARNGTAGRAVLRSVRVRAAAQAAPQPVAESFLAGAASMALRRNGSLDTRSSSPRVGGSGPRSPHGAGRDSPARSPRGGSGVRRSAASMVFPNELRRHEPRSARELEEALFGPGAIREHSHSERRPLSSSPHHARTRLATGSVTMAASASASASGPSLDPFSHQLAALRARLGRLGRAPDSPSGAPPSGAAVAGSPRFNGLLTRGSPGDSPRGSYNGRKVCPEGLGSLPEVQIPGPDAGLEGDFSIGGGVLHRPPGGDGGAESQPGGDGGGGRPAAVAAPAPAQGRGRLAFSTSTHRLDGRPPKPPPSSRGGDGAEEDDEAEEEDDEDHPHAFLEYSSFYVWPPNSSFRLACWGLVSHLWFEYFILALIVLSSALLAADSPRLDRDSPLAHALFIIDTIFTAFFALEMALKLVAKGLVLHPHAYLRNGWDCLDGFIVVTSILSLALSGLSLGPLRALRLVRALRPLRMIRRWRGMQLVVETLLASLPSLFNVLLFGGFLFTIFGILGVQLFAGKFSVCNMVVNPTNNATITSKEQCPQGSVFVCQGGVDISCEDGQPTEAWWGPPMRNFDNIGRALLTLFTVATLDSFMDVAHSCMDATEVDSVPVEDHQPAAGLFIITFVFMGAFFWVNLLVSIIIDHYARLIEEQGDILVSRQAKEYIRIFKFEQGDQREMWKGGLPEGATWLRRWCWRVASNPMFDRCIMLTITLNILVMAMPYFGSSPGYSLGLAYANMVFTLMFAAEAVTKIIALGFRKYIKDHWNKLDLLIVIVSIPDVVSTWVPIGTSSNLTILRILRIGRMFKLIKNAKGLRTLFNTLISATPAIANVGSLLLLLMYIYAILGMNLFGAYGNLYDQAGETQANFDNVGIALSTLFRVFTGDSWGSLMSVGMGCDEDQYQCDWGPSALAAAVFYCSFVIVATLIMLNLVIAVVLDNFIENAQSEGLLKTNNFVDLLKMVISLRMFVRLLRLRINQLKQADRRAAMHRGSRIALRSARSGTGSVVMLGKSGGASAFMQAALSAAAALGPDGTFTSAASNVLLSSATGNAADGGGGDSGPLSPATGPVAAMRRSITLALAAAAFKRPSLSGRSRTGLPNREGGTPARLRANNGVDADGAGDAVASSAGGGGPRSGADGGTSSGGHASPKSDVLHTAAGEQLTASSGSAAWTRVLSKLPSVLRTSAGRREASLVLMQSPAGAPGLTPGQGAPGGPGSQPTGSDAVPYPFAYTFTGSMGRTSTAAASSTGRASSMGRVNSSGRRDDGTGGLGHGSLHQQAGARALPHGSSALTRCASGGSPSRRPRPATASAVAGSPQRPLHSMGPTAEHPQQQVPLQQQGAAAAAMATGASAAVAAADASLLSVPGQGHGGSHTQPAQQQQGPVHGDVGGPSATLPSALHGGGGGAAATGGLLKVRATGSGRRVQLQLPLGHNEDNDT